MTTSTETYTVCESFEEMHALMSDKLNEAVQSIRELRQSLKTLERQHYKELKMTRRYKRDPTVPKKTSGFNKPSRVPVEICSLLGLKTDELLPRTKVTKAIYSYIKEHKLQDPEDKRRIVPNDELKTLFKLGSEDKVSFYNIQSYIKKVYPVTVVTESVVLTEVSH